MKYSKEIHVTAGEMRAKGMNVPTGVPDCAWIKRSARRRLQPGDIHVYAEKTTTMVLWARNELFRWEETAPYSLTSSLTRVT